MDSMLICIIHNSKNNVKYLSNTKLAKIRKMCYNVDKNGDINRLKLISTAKEYFLIG